MSTLSVFRASAGSGKTYWLTSAYLSLLFKNPASYAHTLAVTFTNKATAEMRDRILNSLHRLSIGCPGVEQLEKQLCAEINKDEQYIRSTAANLLASILHDYSKFSVSTIDSFFQKITRSFANEMGLPAGFRLELETNLILAQAVDKLLLELNDEANAEIKDWITRFVIEKIEDDKGWNIQAEIVEFCKEIFKESYQANAAGIEKLVSDKPLISRYKENLKSIVASFETKIKTIGSRGLTLIKSHELDLKSDFHGKSRGPVLVFQEMALLKKAIESKKLDKLLESTDNWTRKDNPDWKNERILNAYHIGLHALVQEASSYILRNDRDYQTARLILAELNALGVINDVYKKMMEICREQNIFLISGTNFLLYSVINENDCPFIYEKTGTMYSNYMIDEFQDTSSLQYRNLLPLLLNSIATGNHGLVVGDVKQAIYRWRNSDWSLLANAIDADFNHLGVEKRVLGTNWRCNEEVTRFNNTFFSMAPKMLQNHFNSAFLAESDINDDNTRVSRQIIDLYRDVVQEVPSSKKNSGGELFIKLIECDDSSDYTGQAIALAGDLVNQQVNNGFKFSDICILVRTNNEAVKITKALLTGTYKAGGNPLPVISNESLVISNSVAVRQLISLLRLLHDSSNLLNEAAARFHWLSCRYYQSNPETASHVNGSMDNNSLKHEINELILDTSSYFHNQQATTEWESYKADIMLLKGRPVYDLVETLSRLLPPNIRSRDSVYLQAFMSLLLKFINDESPDLNKFLEYWDKRGCHVSLSIAANQNALRVMTVHKSKGLEFKSVIIPFATWNINDAKKSTLLWLKPQTPPFNELPLVPVANVKSLAKSNFANDYLQDVINQYIDNLNITYVAFTRARQSLSVIGKQPAKTGEISNISSLLHEFISDTSLQATFPGSIIEPGASFQLCMKDKTTSSDEERPGVPVNLNPERPHISLEASELAIPARLVKIANHFESKELMASKDSNLNYGKIMHRVLEQVVIKEDVEIVLNGFRFKGLLSHQEALLMKDEIEKLLEHPIAKEWFDGSHVVKTERGIVFKGLKRPDRVMIKNNIVTVVDYKFGEARLKEHQLQVGEYINLLLRMGYSEVRGFLWYAANNIIEEVVI